MKTLLRIDASIRKKGSFSRTVGDFFQSQWELKNPGGRIINRDLAEQTVPHLTEPLTEAFNLNKRQQKMLSVSDRIVEEAEACDTLLITSALYNFCLPSTLKCYVDHLVRINKTVSQAADGQHTGLLKNKQAVIITSKGDFYKGTNYEHLDFQDRYLKTILNFIGIQKTEIFSIEGTKNVGHSENIISRVKSEIIDFLSKENP
jgi:FMN-dependent NADH-azoreductase